MIILKTRFVESPKQFVDPLLVITPGNSGYLLSRLNAGAGSPLELRASDIEPWGRKVYYWSQYGDGFLEATGYEDSRDYDAFMQARFGCTEGPVFVAARGGANELVIVAVKPTHTKLEYKHHHGRGPTIDAVDSVIDGYSTSSRAVANKAKRDLLERISPINMLAEQEKQIDLLSMLVVELAEKQSESDRPDWLPAFKAMLEQHSSVQFKGAAGALSDVAGRKAAMRDLQRAYFAKREAGN